MNSTPPTEPEFRGKTLTPVSPRPLHISQPSNIPVLQNQMDPALNDTSTFLVSNGTSADAAVFTEGNGGRSPSESSSTYMEHDVRVDSGESKADHSQDGADGNDDYAMSLEFDDDEGLDNQESAATELNGSTSTAATHSPSLTISHQPDPKAQANGSALATVDTNQHAQEFHDAIAPHSVPTESDAVPAQAPTKSDEAMDVGSGGDVNFQALLDNLSPSIISSSAVENIAAPTTAFPANPSFTPGGSIQSPVSALSTHSTLPPRPPPQAKPTTHPSYSTEDDIRSYHPHNSAPGTGSGYTQNQPNSYRPAIGLHTPVIAPGAPGTASVPGSSLPPPPVAAFQQPPPPGVQQQVPPSPVRNRQRERLHPRSVNSVDDEDEEPWPPEIQKKYDEFLRDERAYVNEAQWDKFPPSSRLFIGNLPSEKVTKRDLFHVFFEHGKLAQISIKQAYGFVQFLNADSCVRALQAEQGRVVRGRKMHLEISKPQKSTRGGAEAGGGRAGANRRSRSPDYGRGGQSPRDGQHFRGTGVRHNGDRMDRAGPDNRYGGAGRDRDFRDKGRVRDDYRPGRSPSPRGFRGRDEYRGGRDRERSRDRYDGARRHGRSRSRSPYGRGGTARYRSRSPRAREIDDDLALPLPKREPRDVPDVQILVLDELDRAFISFVEKAFLSRGIRSDVLIINPRLNLDAVIRRQILEGVQAVSRLNRQSQNTGKIPMQIFDRSGGPGNVRFDEYDNNLDPAVAAELVVRAKQTQAAPPVNQFGLPSAQPYQPPPTQYGQQFVPQVPQQQQQQQQPAAVAAPPPNLANLITQLDGNSLQKLLGALQQQPSSVPQNVPHQQQQSPTGMPTDFTSLLGGAARPQQQQSFQQPSGNPYAALALNPAFAGNPALASLLAGAGNRAPQQSMQQQQPQQHGQPAQQVQNILEQIAKWQK